MISKYIDTKEKSMRNFIKQNHIKDYYDTGASMPIDVAWPDHF